jgi:hypothetical protein
MGMDGWEGKVLKGRKTFVSNDDDYQNKITHATGRDRRFQSALEPPRLQILLDIHNLLRDGGVEE